MTFFKQLLSDSKLKAEAITTATKSAANRVIDTQAGQAVKNLSYKGLVNGVGLALAAAEPCKPAASWVAQKWNAAIAPTEHVCNANCIEKHEVKK